ncbi:MAG: sigma-54-dependent transcriptional regulator [Candidatus Hydrogenedens sp.]
MKKENAEKVILLVDDDNAQRELLSRYLTRAGFSVLAVANYKDAKPLFGHAHLILLDVRLPDANGVEKIPEIKEQFPGIPVILLTAFIDVRDAVQAIRQGAVDYLEKPVDLDELIEVIQEQLGTLPTDRTEDSELPEDFICYSTSMQKVVQDCLRVSPTKATVLITGESGAGKEWIARLIHQFSERKNKPLVVIDCTHLPETLAESILFGHEPGAFTGAITQQKGQLEEANGGTLFLDEVGELPLSVQPKLLRVLEGSPFRRIGGTKDIHVDLRIISATNRNLETEVQEGKFRQDLFYRLHVITIHVPPLRERVDDILPLAEFFLKPYNKTLSPSVQRLLLRYPWFGNVRELRNAMERSAILANGPMIMPEDLPEIIQNYSPSDESHQPPSSLRLDELEREAILNALKEAGGNRTRTAEILGISRRTLIYKLRAYGL